MKKNLCLLLLSPILLSAVGCGSTAPKEEPEPEKELTPVDVVLISGQSNAVGCTQSECIAASIGIEEAAIYKKGYPTIQISYDCWTKDWPAGGGTTYYSQNKSTGFVKVALGQGNSGKTFGPEIGIAEAMHEKYANKLFLIKYACGASNLRDDWMDETTPMYSRFINYVRAQMSLLVEQGYAPTIKAFCWMQGEGDAYPGYYLVYQKNLRTFVTNVRNDLKDLAGNKEIPFIDAGISDAETWQYYREINEAKAEFAKESEYNFFIDTIAAGMHTDQEPFFDVDINHYDSESEILLGHLFAEVFEQFLEQPKE